jgi:hypothetical protein
VTTFSKTISICVMVDDKGAAVFDRHGQPRTLVFDSSLGVPHGYVKVEDTTITFSLPEPEVLVERWRNSLVPKGNS